MNYNQCLSYLDRLGNEVLTMKFGLDTIRTLLEGLGNPQRAYPCVLIAGTNGKGSVARFLNAMFSSSGIRNALYTSPHLVRMEERFGVNDRFIDPHWFAHCFSRVVETIERLNFPAHPTFFDTLTATAFLYFSQQEAEIAFLEVGMGGRLDSTNIADPILSIITPVGFDHQQFLGDTLELIAREKAGIMRSGRPVLWAPQRPEVRRVLLSEAATKHACALELDRGEIEELVSEEGKYRFDFHGLRCRPALYGRQQAENAALAVRAAELLGERGFSLTPAGMEKGLAEVEWPGRLQKVSDHPTVFLDGAHNLDAAENLVRFSEEHTEPPRSLVFGMMRDKDIGKVLAILKPCFERVYLTRVDSPRAATLDELQALFPDGIAVAEPFEAYQRALASATTIVVAGSFYLVGKILQSLERN